MSKFINQFPYTDFHELNLDVWIKKLKTAEANIADLQEQMSQIVVVTEEHIQQMIDTAIASNNIQLAAQMQELKNTITTEYQGYVQAQISSLTTYIDNQDVYYNGLAQGYAATALSDAKAYIDAEVLDYTMMINPITGDYEDVRNVVNDIVSYFHTQDSLTAAEYDALDLTASYYDGKQLNAYDYDFNGKTLLP